MKEKKSVRIEEVAERKETELTYRGAEVGCSSETNRQGGYAPLSQVVVYYVHV